MVARVAVLSDVHANPWALQAVLADVARAGVEVVVNCGDLVAGPWPDEVVDLLAGCAIPVVHVRGNGDRMVADAHDDLPGWRDDVPAPALAAITWAARHLGDDERALVGAMPLTVELNVEGVGTVAFFHATPTSDEEIILPTSPEGDVTAALDGLEARVAVCGHTHLPDDRDVGGRRWVNAGSVGKPFDHPAPSWLLLGPDVALRRCPYDTDGARRAAVRARGTTAAGRAVAEDFAASLVPPGRQAVLEVFAPAAAAQRGHLAARSMLATLDR